MECLVEWDDKFNTGNFVIDYQHKRLVRMINELDEIRRHEDLRPFLLKLVFDEVADYTDYHFKTEEKMMADSDYSMIEEHKKIHQKFIETLQHFKDRFEHQEREIDLRFCHFLKDWVFDHIAVEDPKFIAELVHGNGIV